MASLSIAPEETGGHGLLTGRVVVVTAAAGTGIGSATARRALLEGADVMISDHHERRLTQTRDGLSALNLGRVESVVCDVTSTAQVDALISSTTARFGRLDVLVNNAGLGGQTPVIDMTDEEWDRVLNVTLTSVMRATRAALGYFSEAAHGGAIINNGRNAYSWGAQAASVTNSDTKQFGEYQIDVKKLIAYPKATEEMLEDGDYDIEALIMDDATMGFAEGEAYGFLLGNGVLQPRGLMTVPTAYTGDNTRAWGTVQKFKTGVNGAFAATPNGGDIFIESAMSLRSAYRTGAVWAMNRFTLATAMKLKDSEGNYIWQPTWNLQDAPFGTICGIPVAPDFDHLADVATNSLSIVVGNLNQAYQIVDKRGISVIRDNITSPGNVNWYISKRTGGDLVNSEAVRFIEFKA